MLTLGRFKALAASYGGDLERWPERFRREAATLTASSVAARRILEAERELDAAIAGADRSASTAGLQAEAALTRLRSGVAARIAPARAGAGGSVRHGWRAAARPPIGLSQGLTLCAPDLRAIGLVGAASIAVAAGLAIGATSKPPPGPNAVLSLLQTTPLPYSD